MFSLFSDTFLARGKQNLLNLFAVVVLIVGQKMRTQYAKSVFCE